MLQNCWDTESAPDSTFSHFNRRNLPRAHSFQLFPQTSTLNSAYTSSPFWVVNVCNKLVVDIVSAPSVFAYAYRLKHFKLEKIYEFISLYRHFGNCYRVLCFFSYSALWSERSSFRLRKRNLTNNQQKIENIENRTYGINVVSVL